jgi:hypothetical protein
VTSTCAASASAYGLGKSFDGTKAAECLTELRAVRATKGSCDRAPDVFACEAVFKSATTNGAGQSCASAADCANGDASFGLCVGSGANGTCVLVTRGRSGDACVGTRANGTTADTAGAKASATALCFLADDLQCDAKTKKCAPRGIVGSDCDPANEAACVDAAYCPIDAKQCTTRTAAGGSCSDSDECQSGYQCSGGDDGHTTCSAYAQAGQACPRGDECDPSLSCDSTSATCVKDTSAALRACNGQSSLGL